MQPFSPTKQHLAASERLLLRKGLLHRENNAVYGNLSGCAKLFHGRRYSQKKVLNSLHQYAVKYNNKPVVTAKTETLAANIKLVLNTAKKSNKKAANKNCIARLFSSSKVVNLDLYKADLKKLQSKIRADKIEKAQEKYEDLQADVEEIQIEDLEYDAIVALATSVQHVMTDLAKVRKGASKKSKAKIDGQIAYFKNLLGDLNNKIQEFDLHTIEKAAKAFDSNKDSPSGLKKVFQDELNELQNFSSKLAALNISEIAPLTSIPILIRLISQCQKLIIQKAAAEKAREDKTCVKVKLIMQVLKGTDTSKSTYVEDVTEACNNAKVKLYKQRNRLHNTSQVIKKIDDKIAKINNAYKHFKDCEDRLQKEAIRLGFVPRPPASVEEVSAALEELKAIKNSLEKIPSFEKLDFAHVPLVNLWEQVQVQVKEAEAIFVKKFEEDIQVKIDAIQELEDQIERVNQFEYLKLWIKNHYDKALGQAIDTEMMLEGKSAALEIVQEGLDEELDAIISSMKKIDQELNSEEEISVATLRGYNGLLRKLKELRPDSNVEELKKKLSAKIREESDQLFEQLENKWNQECLPRIENALAEFSDKAIEFEPLFAKLEDIHFEWVAENKSELSSCEEWLGYSSSLINYLLAYLEEVKGEIRKDFDCLKHIEKAVNPSLEEMRVCLDNYEKTLAEKGADDASFRYMKQMLKLSHHIKLRAKPYVLTEQKVDLQRKCKTVFIEQQRLQCLEEIAIFEKAKADLQEKLKEKQSPWKEEIEEYLDMYQNQLDQYADADKPTILDLVENQATELMYIDNFLNFFNECLTENKSALRPLILHNEETLKKQGKTSPSLSALLEQAKLLYLEDFQANNIYSRDALRAYVVANSVKIYGYLKFSGWFKI